MIVPRDRLGQWNLWRQLNQVFGSNSSSPEPTPCPTCPPRPTVGPCPTCPPCPEQKMIEKSWDDVLSFRKFWEDNELIKQGEEISEKLEPNTWYMHVSPLMLSGSIVREVLYTSKPSFSEYPSVDGFSILYSDNSLWTIGNFDSEQLEFQEGDNSVWCLSWTWLENYLQLTYQCMQVGKPPRVLQVEALRQDALRGQYLSLWNWGYQFYDPEMDYRFECRIIMEAD